MMAQPMAPYYPTAVPARPDPPTAGMVLAIIGGIFIVLGSLFELAVGAAISSVSFGYAGGIVELLGLIGLALGVLVIFLGVLMHQVTEYHTVAGVLIIVFAVVSLVTSSFGGFVLGFILALIGGILGLTWRPNPHFIQYVPAPVQRMCTKCGRAVDPNVAFCPYCGNQLPR
jgi:hypothetical protein